MAEYSFNPSVTTLKILTSLSLSIHMATYLESFRQTFHSLKLCRDEVEAVVQVASCGHLLQVGVAVLVLVYKVVRD